MGPHGGPPAEVLVQQAAALVVYVVRETVNGRTQGDHGLERLRAKRRHLQAVEAAPAYAHHADLAVAPRLCRNPVDDFDRVGLFLRGVFVFHDAVAVAAPAHVDAQAGISALCEPRMRQRIARAGAVAFSVGQIFQDHRNRVIQCIEGLPHPGRQAAAVGQSDAKIGVFADVAQAVLTGIHAPDIRRSPEFVNCCRNVEYVFKPGNSPYVQCVNVIA